MYGILCGLESEATIARNIKGVEVVCAAARPEKARGLARDLVRRGVTRLMSFGIAGGLEPGLPIGSLVIGTHVVSTNSNWTCDGSWVSSLSSKLPHAHCGGVWGSETLVPTAIEKAALHQKSRCLIVDMESQCAAEIAAEAQLPLIVVRAVCDASNMDVPPIVMAAISEDGSIAYGRALGHVMRNPSQIADLFHVGKGTNRALKVLKASVSALAH